MIDLYKEDKKYWIQKKNQKWLGCLSCTEKQLGRLYDDIGKMLGKIDWKKDMEEDKKLFTQRLVPGMTAKIVRGKYLLTKIKNNGNKKSNKKTR
jgi:hypothetical protein